MRASAIRALFAVASRPEVVSLAGGMPNIASLPLDQLAVEAASLVAEDGRVALQYGSGQGIPEAARADLPVDGAGGNQRPSRRRRGHRRIADGARPDHPGVLRPRRRDPGRGSVLRRCAWHLHGLSGVRRARRDGRRRVDPRGVEGRDRVVPRAPDGGSSSSTPFRTSTTRPASRSRRNDVSRSPRSVPPQAFPSWRTIRTACSASMTRSTARSVPTIRTTSSIWVRSRRRSPPGCGSGGCWRPMRSRRSWCWRTSPPR